MRIHRNSAIAACLVAVLVLVGGVANVSAAGNTYRIDPSATSVAQDATFTVKVIQNASVPTSGAQVGITFDRTKVQITTVTRGAPWAAAPIYAGASAKDISDANKNGKLETVAAAFLPPTAVPAGEKEFVIVVFKAIACGQAKLGLPIAAGDATFIDGRDATYGAAVKATATTGATVTVCSGGAGGSLAPDGSSPTPGGSVLGTTSSPDLGAGSSGDPIVDPSADAGAPSTDPGSVAQSSPSPSILPAGAAGTGDCPSCAARQDWLTFGLAAMAVAAVGLALLIVLVLGTLLVAGIVGLIAFLRHRRAPRSGPAPTSSSDHGPTTGPTDSGTPTAPADPAKPATSGADVLGVGEPGPG